MLDCGENRGAGRGCTSLFGKRRDASSEHCGFLIHFSASFSFSRQFEVQKRDSSTAKLVMTSEDTYGYAFDDVVVSKPLVLVLSPCVPFKLCLCAGQSLGSSGSFSSILAILSLVHMNLLGNRVN